MKSAGSSSVRIGVAAAVATVGVVVAAVTEQRLVSAVAIAAAAGIALWSIGSLRPHGPVHARRGAGIVVASILLAGIPAVGLLTPTDRVSAADDGQAVEESEPDDLSAALARIVERADEVAPDGAASILQIEIDGDRETVYVLNQQNGMRVYTYRSRDAEWQPPTSMRTSERTVFGRQDIRRLDLNTARDRAIETWKRVGATDPDVPDPAAAISVRIEPRSADDKVVARFAGGGFPIEVDGTGVAADTAGAASVGDFLDVADRAMVAAGLDPAEPLLNRIEFKSLDDGASWHGRAEAGFELHFDGGPISSIAVDVGTFPVIRKATVVAEPDGFSLTGLTGATMASVRDDLVRRGRVPAYDRDVIGARIGVARADDRPGRVPVTIQMVVGPRSAEVAGVYSTRGRFLRDGTD